MIFIANFIFTLTTSTVILESILFVFILFLISLKYMYNSPYDTYIIIRKFFFIIGFYEKKKKKNMKTISLCLSLKFFLTIKVSQFPVSCKRKEIGIGIQLTYRLKYT